MYAVKRGKRPNATSSIVTKKTAAHFDISADKQLPKNSKQLNEIFA